MSVTYVFPIMQKEEGLVIQNAKTPCLTLFHTNYQPLPESLTDSLLSCPLNPFSNTSPHTLSFFLCVYVCEFSCSCTLSCPSVIQRALSYLCVVQKPGFTSAAGARGSAFTLNTYALIEEWYSYCTINKQTNKYSQFHILIVF